MTQEQIKATPKKSKLPWVFWITVSWRPQWFSYWWKTRGANYVEYQVWKFRITIGRPWIQDVVYRHRKDYGSNESIRQANKDNLRYWFSFLIK